MDKLKEILNVLDYNYAFWSGVVSRLEETLTEIKNL